MPPKVEREALTFGPVLGMRDSHNESSQSLRHAKYLENAVKYVRDTGALMSRPGYTQKLLDDANSLQGAVARTGTITSIDAGTGAIIGSGTLFSTELAVADIITVSGVDYRISSITNNTSALANIVGPGAIGASYTYYPGSIKDGKVYWIGEYRVTDGTIHRLALCKTTAGQALGFAGTGAITVALIEYDGFTNSTHPWTVRTSASMNSVALALDARIYGTVFANYLIFTDGTNRPRKISSTWVLSNLTDGNYAFQGGLVQYYGKLFGIDASDNITLRWSEENDPDTGFGTGTSDNSWSLRQTSPDGLTALWATNDALYCFRANSIAIITGAANSDFRSAGVVDAIQFIGTLSPDAIITVGSSLLFLDQSGRPQRYQPGYGIVAPGLWESIQETTRAIGVTTAQLRAAWCRYDPMKEMVHFGYRASTSATTNDQMLVFDVKTWECLGLHKVPTSYAAAGGGSPASVLTPVIMDHAYATLWHDENNKFRLVLANGDAASYCGVYIQQTEDTPSASAQDSTASGVLTVTLTVETPKLGADVVMEKSFDRLTVGFVNVGGASTGYALWYSSYRDPYTAYTTRAIMALSGSTNQWDGWTAKQEQTGLDAGGRWFQCKLTTPIVTATNTATRATFDTLTVTAIPDTDDYQNR